MNRRDLLATIVLGATGLDTQQPGPETVYIPKIQRVEDRNFMHDFMD